MRPTRGFERRGNLRPLRRISGVLRLADPPSARRCAWAIEPLPLLDLGHPPLVFRPWAQADLRPSSVESIGIDDERREIPEAALLVSDGGAALVRYAITRLLSVRIGG